MRKKRKNFMENGKIFMSVMLQASRFFIYLLCLFVNGILLTIVR